jgi:DNA-binding transcriptional MerR regulator
LLLVGRKKPMRARRRSEAADGGSGRAAGRASEPPLMTVGELARRTGLTPKAVRRLEGLGLIYNAGRSEANYRLFDESALWCVGVIRNLRSLGLTFKEIQQLSSVYLERPGEPIGPHLAALLERAGQRIQDRLDELLTLQRRIEHFRRENPGLQSGTVDAGLTLEDPRQPRISP